MVRMTFIAGFFPGLLDFQVAFHGPRLVTFQTDRLDLRGLDLGKSDVIIMYFKQEPIQRRFHLILVVYIHLLYIYVHRSNSM